MGRLSGRGLGSRIGADRGSRIPSRALPSGEAAPAAWKKWYSSARWRDLRRAVFARDGYVCQATGRLCGGKYPAPDSPVCDHVKPHRGDPARFWDAGNLQTVCKAYHDREKQRLEATGALDD